jgi:thymidylate kinase
MEHTIEDQAVQAEVKIDLLAPAGATQASSQLLLALQQGRIRFAHWKSNSHLAEGLAGKTDLDLLIYPADREAFDAVMASLDYKKLQSQPWSTYPQVEDWIGMDEETGNLLHIHTHYALVTGIKHVKHLYLPWTEEFFRQLTTDPQTGWPIPKPEMEALVLLIRIWAKTPPFVRLRRRPAIPVHMQQELLGLLHQGHPDQLADLARKLGLQVPADLGLRVRKITEENDSLEIIKLAKYFYGQVKRYYRKPWPLALAISFYYKLYLRAVYYLNRLIGPLSQGKHLADGGKIIALVGCDGSGKSSLSKDILSWLTYKIDTHYFYLGKNPYIKSYNKIIVAKENILFRKSWLSGAVKKLIGGFYFVTLIRRKVAMLQLARKMKKQGSVVLCDRFPQQDIPGMNDGPHLRQSKNKWTSELEQHQFNQIKSLPADLIFRLQVSPETASKRKPEHDFEKIKIKSESMTKISFPGSVMINIDSNASYEQVLLSIKREIWKQL